VEQFHRFRKDHSFDKEVAPSKDCPINEVSWYTAVAYCNWLSEQEGIAKEQWCYLPNEAGNYGEGMKMAPNYLKRTGYRLPTEAEWEYGCRAGAATSFSCGEAEDVLGKYAWYLLNSLGKSHPVGLLKPNDLGLCDMHGNAWEWTQGTFKDYRPATTSDAIDDIADINDISDAISNRHSRVLRGVAFNLPAVTVRSAYRNWYVPAYHSSYVGLRPAKTFATE
jgi:formylglycine-generating enzyme required for sulfatase activity